MYQLELMAFRQGREGLEVLIQHHNKWKALISRMRKAAWDMDSVNAAVSSSRGNKESVHYAGDYETKSQDMAQVFCLFLGDNDDFPLEEGREAMWVNADVLIQKIVHRPEKFAPELLETLTTALKCVRH